MSAKRPIMPTHIHKGNDDVKGSSKKDAGRPAPEAAQTAPAEQQTAAPATAAAEGAVVAPPGELEQIKERLLRLQADFDNFRKRTLREKNELFQKANEDIMLELLPVLDHAELGLKHAEEQGVPAAYVDGLRMVADQLRGVLQKFGLAPIETTGRVFNPGEHEGIACQPSDSVPEGCIILATRTGYRLGNAVLRPAQVVVSSGPSMPDPEAGAGDEPK